MVVSTRVMVLFCPDSQVATGLFACVFQRFLNITALKPAKECKKKPLLAEEEGEKIAGALFETPHYSPSAGHVKFFFRRNFSVRARQTAGPDL